MKCTPSIAILVYLFVVSASIAQGSNIYGWGKNDFGQLGLGTYNSDPIYTITQIPFYSSLSITRVTVGENTHFATTGTTYYSCGSNSDGQLGQGTTASSTPNPTVMSDLSGGNYTIYALPKATVAYSPSQKTASGCGFAAGYLRGYSSGPYYKFQPILPSYGFAGNIDKVYTANGCCFVQLASGLIYTAGVSTDGVFGLGVNESSPSFQQMTFWESENVNFSKIFSTQAYSVCAQAVNMSVFCWGSNSVGQLGLGHLNDNIFTPALVQFFEDQGLLVSQLKQGMMHAIALTCGGRVFTWGANQRGQMGTGTSDLDLHPTPTEILFLQDKNVVEIVSGAYHNFARTANNDWYFWGMGDTGVSGLGNTPDILTPTLIPQLKTLSINRVESGAYSQFAIGWNIGDAPTSPPSCPLGWNVDDCNPANPGDFPCGPNMNCTNTERSYICTCKPGFELETNDTNACQDIDECLQNPCLPQATCNNTMGSFFCDCPWGYVGDGLKTGKGCIKTVCGNGIVERGEECDTFASPSCCNSSCYLLPSGDICRNSTVPCDKTEYCDGTNQLCPANDWIPGSFCDYCGNGQCNNDTEKCSNCPQDCGTCDACTGILCNGKCVTSPLDCIVVCQPTEFACASGLCVSDFTTCATHNCSNTTECWDGSCANDLSLCPLIPSCPILTKRCFGRCIGVEEECEVGVEVNCTIATDGVCLDGQCHEECPQFNGCSTGLIRCPSGDCTDDIEVCKGDCPDGLYVCADNTCNLPNNCSAVLRFEAAIPFTQHIPANKNSTMDILSTNGIPIVSLNLFAGTFKNVTSVDVSAVSFSSIKEVKTPDYWGNNTDLESNIFSSAVAFDVPDRTKFSKNITVSFNGTMPSNFNLSDLCLGYVNSSNQWDCASELSYVNGTFIGNTSHFTPFAVIKRIRPPVFNSLSRDDLNVFKNISVNSVIIYVYCGLLIVFGVLFLWAYHADKEEKKHDDEEKAIRRNEVYVYQEEPRTPPPRRKSLAPFRPETPPAPAGIVSQSPAPSRLSDAPLLNESTSSASSRPSSLSASAASPTPSSSRPPSMAPSPLASSSTSPSPAPPSSAPSTISKGSTPFANGEMSVVPPETGRAQRPRARTLVMKEAAQTRFTTKHKWLSIYFTARIENLPRVSRVTILLCMILTNMTVAAVFYNSENRSTTGQRILVGVISSLIAFVLSFAIFTMFKLVNKKYRAICYTVSTIYILGTGFLTLWYNLKLEQSTAYGWCISAAIGIVQDAILNEPAKIVVISLLIAFCPFLPFVTRL